MTKLLRFLIILALIPSSFYSQTDTVGYYGDNGVTGFNTATVLHNNLSTCQSSIWVDGNASIWNGSVWSSGTFSLIVNGTNIGSYTGPATIDLTAYIPVTSVQVNSSASTWHTVSAYVAVVSASTSTPNGGPATSDVYYCVGDVTAPLTATLTSTGTTLNWFTTSYGSGYSATAPTPSSAAAGATSYWVSQEDAAGCESVRSEIVVNVQSVSGQTVTAGQSSFLCAGSTTIDVASTETGVNYTLRDNSNNAIISGPSAGTGGAIQFNTGAITSTTTYNVLAESVRNSNALNFGGNGSGDFIDMGTGINSALTGTNTITVEAWINRTTTGSLQTIASNYGSGMQFLLRVDSDKIGFWVSNGSFTNVPGATTLPTNTWVHVAGTWDGTTMKVYVNGVLDGSKLYSGTMPSVTNTFRIGGGFGSEYFPGAISNVSVWSTTRTDTDIFNDQNRCFSGSETGLLALYKMDDGVGNSTLTDLTGNGYDGTLTNMDVNTSWINGPVSLMCATACSIQMAATPTVTINSIVDQAVNTSSYSAICSADTAIEIASSETGVSYYLRDNSNDSIIVGPIEGTGGALQFFTGDLTGTTGYNVYASKNSGSLNFNGIDKYAINNSPVGLPTGGIMTVEAWVKPNSYPDGTFNGVVSWGTRNCSPAGSSFLLSMTNQGRPSFASWCNDFVPTSGPSANLNQWNHIAAVVNGTSVKLYLNGYEWAGTLPLAVNVVNGAFCVGSTDIPGRIFDGEIDEVRVWNTERTVNELGNNRYTCLTGAELGLTNYYQMEEGFGSVLTDLVSGNNLTVVGPNWMGGSPVCSDCSLQMSTTPSITITPIQDQTVAITDIELCLTNTGTSVTTGSSESGVDYYLIDNAMDTIVDGPITGTGSGLTFNTGSLASSMTYNISAYTADPSNALNFDGANDYVTLSNESNYDFTTNMTVEFWIQTTVLQGLDGLVTKGDDSWRVHGGPTGNVMFAGQGSFADFQSVSSVDDGSWHHVAVTYDGTIAIIYIDGVFENSVAASAPINNSSFMVAIGENLQAAGRFFQGNMDEVRIWSVARTVTEINNFMDKKLQGSEVGLVSYYNFNQGIAGGNNVVETNLFDEGPSMNTGTLVNFALTGATSNWINGKSVFDCGLQLSQTVTVTVQDVLAPSPVVSILSDITAECSITSLTAPTATDNCATTVIVTNNATLPISTQGTTIVTWTYDDGNGNTFTQTQNVVITDVTAPVVPTIADATGECTVTVVAPTTTDNCSGTITGTTTDALTYTSQGTSTITWFFDDGNGNISTQTQNVVIADITNPTITAPGDMSVVANAAGCEATGVSLGTETAVDNCGTPVVTNDAPATFPLGATTVTWTATDAGGNTATAMQIVTVTSDLAIASSPVVTNVTCNGNSDGAINITVSGGTMAYSYSWDNTATTEDLTGVGAGSYTVTVTDANGCTDASAVAVTEPTAITIVVDNVTNPSACGVSDGSVMVTTTGGTPTYSFLWDDAGSTATEDVSSIGAGAYTLTVTDANGCVQTSSSSLSDPNGPVVVIDSVWNLNCFGDIDGAIFSTISGGTGTLTIDWDNDGTGDNDDIDDISILAVGTYNVVVTDAVNCVTSANATITEPAVITVTTTTTDVLCNGDATGTSALTATGGTGTLVSNWGTVDTNALASGYAVYTVTDANACVLMDSVLITEPAVLALTAVGTDEMNGNDGTINLTVAGGTPTYGYSWDNASTTEDLTGLTAGTYVVTVTDANGCVDSLSVIIDTQVGIEENGISAVIYPNPTSGIVTIEFAQILDGTITVLDGIGKVVLTERITNIKQIIDLSNNERGIYFLQISKGESNTMIKIVLQ